MSDSVFPAYAALFFGVFLAVFLVVPFAGVQYRRRGGLTVGIVVVHFLVLVYLVALATYTLLPLPTRVANFCDVHDVTPQLIPGRFVADIFREAAVAGGGPLALLRNPAMLQIVFNVALFVPLGMILRYFTKVPVWGTALIGLGTSLFIEFTQVTGNWFLYPCAYRLFDADDLLANTTGVLVGALLAPLLRVLPSQELRRPGEPRPITLLRRLLGMLCDWVVIIGAGLTVAFLYLVLVPDRDAVPTGVDVFFRYVAGGMLVVIVQLVWIVTTARTIGETIVRVEPVPPSSSGLRVLRWAVGVGGYGVLSLLQASGPSTVQDLLGPVLGVVVLVSVVAVFVTRRHRGIAYVLLRWEIQDDRTANVPALSIRHTDNG